jgi:ABC-type transport system involved in cytochrome c biogenesis ATPase subunit
MSVLPRTLSGRGGECATLDGLLEGVRGGRSAALVVRGEAGVGKTALLRYAIESAAGLRVIRAVGVEPEMDLAFATLHQLCVPMLDHLEHLPSRLGFANLGLAELAEAAAHSGDTRRATDAVERLARATQPCATP